jgi:hypothetical protein
MSKNEVDIALDRHPEFWRVSVLKVSARATIEISQKISQDFDRRLIPRKSGYVIITDVTRSQASRTKMKLPPVGRILALKNIRN